MNLHVELIKHLQRLHGLLVRGVSESLEVAMASSLLARASKPVENLKPQRQFACGPLGLKMVSHKLGQFCRKGLQWLDQSEASNTRDCYVLGRVF